MQGKEQEFSLKSLFVPLTTLKAIHLIIIVGFIVFGNMLFNGFVWDDIVQIVNNKLVHSTNNITSFFYGFNFHGNIALYIYYKPIFYTVISFIYSIAGQNTFPFHLFQLSLHIASSCLVFIYFKKIFRETKISNNNLLPFLLSLIFLVHPINTEAVVYISSLHEALYVFFGLLVLNVLSSHKITRIRLITGGLLMLLSLLSKESGVLFLFIICFYHLLFNKGKALHIVLAVCASLGIYMFMRFGVAKLYLDYGNSKFPIVESSLIERLQTMPAIFIYYIKTFFYPDNLSISQDWIVKSRNLDSFYLPLFLDSVIILSLLSLGFYLWKIRSRYFKIYLFFSSWLLAGIGVHMHIIPLDMTVATRWFYFSSVGMIGLIGLILSKINVGKNYICILLIIFIIAALSTRTFFRNFDWKNQLSIYSSDSYYNKTSTSFEGNFGSILYVYGKKEEAKIHLQRAVDLNPGYWVNWTNLGVFYYNTGDYVMAEKCYKEAIKNSSTFSPAYENYSRLLLLKGGDNGRKAKEFTEDALKTFSNNSTLWLNLSLANYKMGLYEAATSAAKQAYTLEQNEKSKYIYFRLKNNLPVQIK